MERILQAYLVNEYNNGRYFVDPSGIISILDDIKKKYLYPNDFHGLYHSQKVCFFAYLIGLHEGLLPDEMKILLDAAKYHDIGRAADKDNRDERGYSSVRKIDKLIEDGIIKYDNPLDIYYLKAVIEAGTRKDKNDLSVYQNWLFELLSNLEEDNLDDELDYSKFKRLTTILKDADTLDVFRFKNSEDIFNQSILRLDYSKNLVPKAKEINDFYKEVNIEEQYYLIKDKYEKNTYDKVMCYHSVGFDFFKALSILRNGIVSSYNAKINDINLIRNYNGNNSEFWISVVNADSNSTNREAYNRYVKNGISFLCYVDELVEGVERTVDNGSCLPRLPDDFHDERFVFDKIPLHNIQFLSIPRKLLDASIKDLKYIFCYLHYSIVSANVNSYIDNIESYCNISLDRRYIDKKLEEFKQAQIDFNGLSQEEVTKAKLGEYRDTLLGMQDELNTEIQNCMQIGFSELLNKDASNTITVREVLKYMLDNANIDYDVIDENENEKDDFLDSMNLPFYKDPDSFFIRLSTFDLNKTDSEDKTR